MYCSKCGAKLDVKLKQCPHCMEKVKPKTRMKEYKELRRYARKNQKTVLGNPDIEAVRTAEKYKAHFGRKKRNEFIIECSVCGSAADSYRSYSFSRYL